MGGRGGTGMIRLDVDHATEPRWWEEPGREFKAGVHRTSEHELSVDTSH